MLRVCGRGRVGVLEASSRAAGVGVGGGGGGSVVVQGYKGVGGCRPTRHGCFSGGRGGEGSRLFCSDGIGERDGKEGREGCFHSSTLLRDTVKKALVISKTSRYEYELNHNPNMSVKELAAILENRGSDMMRLKERFDIHEENVNALVTALRRNGIKTKVVKDLEVRSADVNVADAIFTCGGDGTFLQAAGKVYGEKPIFGINSDPERSKGHLCLRQKVGEGETGKDELNVAEICEKLFDGRFRWLYRSRIRITLLEGDNHPYVVPHRALNDVVFVERDPGKNIYYELSINGNKWEKQKSTGVIASTGTGSTAWFHNVAKMYDFDVKRIFDIAGSEISAARAKELTEEYNKGLVFDPERMEMGFVVREPIDNGIFSVSKAKGMAYTLKLRSRSWDARMVIDGGSYHKFDQTSEFDFKDGRAAILQLFDEDVLKTANWVSDQHEAIV
eukprot:Nk52_evm1s2237 gene=Nk52_evmTU1s2237